MKTSRQTKTHPIISNRVRAKKHCIKISTLVDDIYTTGSTIESMSKILKENGVEKVYFVTMAIVDNL